MKALGVVRKLDNLGRIVLPIELRRNLDVQVGDSLEIYVEDEKVILKKYNPACILCGEANDMVQHEGKNFCRKCIERIRTKKF